MTNVLTALLAVLLMGTADEIPIRNNAPVYELTLPPGYQPVNTGETPPRYTRPRGREIWALVSAIVVDSTTALPQNLNGVQAEEVLSRVPLPPEAQWSFHTLRWKDFEIGSFEYRAVVSNMPVFGLAAVVPLQGGSVTVLVYAPEPMAREAREDFNEILMRITKSPTHWHSPEYYQKIRSMDRIAKIGVGMMLLYPIVWGFFLRGHPERAHWLRTAWFAANAVLLFIPISSPGEMTIINNLLVNAMLPTMLLLFAARRIKMGIEMG